MNHSNGNRLWRRTGFTLLEMVLVLGIVAAIVAVAAPRYANSLNYYRADLASKRVAADLAMARNNAWAAGARRTATFTVGTNSYVMTGIRGLNQATADYAVNLASEPYYSTINSVSFGGAASVTFDGYGMPDHGGSVVIQAGTIRKTVQLDANSGAVSLP